MRSFCGKTVKNSWKAGRKACVRSSTSTYPRMLIDQCVRVKAVLIPRLIPRLHPQSSTQKIALSPLFEYIFYPVSTAPNTTTALLKSLERY